MFFLIFLSGCKPIICTGGDALATSLRSFKFCHSRAGTRAQRRAEGSCEMNSPQEAMDIVGANGIGKRVNKKEVLICRSITIYSWAEMAFTV